MRKDNDNPRRGQDAESVWAELRRTVYTRRRHEPGSPPRACRAAPSSGLQPSPPRAHRTARASGSTPVGLNFPSPERLHSLESRAPLPARGPVSERSGLRDSLGCSPESGREGLFHAGCLKSSTCPTSPGAALIAEPWGGRAGPRRMGWARSWELAPSEAGGVPGSPPPMGSVTARRPQGPGLGGSRRLLADPRPGCDQGASLLPPVAGGLPCPAGACTGPGGQIG